MQLDNTNSPAPLVFTHVDGVLTNALTYWTQKEGASPTDLLDITALKLVEKLCKVLGAKVVMDTTWAEVYPTAEAWREVFAAKGVDIPVVDVLPQDGKISWHKAQAYAAAQSNAPWVLFEAACLPPHLEALITVSPKTGLTIEELTRAVGALAPRSELLEDLRELEGSFGRNR